MVEAIVLIQAKVGESSAVASAIAQLEGVMSADVVSGPYDVIARAQAENIDELGRMVVSKMQSVKGVTRTVTARSSVFERPRSWWEHRAGKRAVRCAPHEEADDRALVDLGVGDPPEVAGSRVAR